MLNRFKTGALLAAVLGAGFDASQYQDASAPAVAAETGGPKPRQRKCKVRGSGRGLCLTRKGPGRYNRNIRGHRRYPVANGPDSINARSVALRLVDRGELEKARSYIQRMKDFGQRTALLFYALEQAERFAARAASA